jgi:hypothetical protein
MATWCGLQGAGADADADAAAIQNADQLIQNRAAGPAHRYIRDSGLSMHFQQLRRLTAATPHVTCELDC